AAYRALATYEDAKNLVVAPGSTGLADRSPPLALATLTHARGLLRAGRHLRAAGDREGADAANEEMLALLGEPTGMYARPAEALVAKALLALSDLATSREAALTLLGTAREHARRSDDAGLLRRIDRRLGSGPR